MPRTIHVIAPSRLHFGLWSLAGNGRQYGGVGAMVDRPGLALSIRPADKLAAEGPLAERALGFARCWAEFHRLALPQCAIQMEHAPPEHAGLGTGTQLGLAVAAGLNAFHGLPSQTPQELAISVGRGLRSAVGTHGFVLGGLIVEQGKLPGEPISPLDCRIDLPDEWRFVLVQPAGLAGLAGDCEAEAIAALPVIAEDVTQALIAEVRDQLVPAAATADFASFAASLYRYGHTAGLLFAARQGGAYNGPVLTAIVELIRKLGFAGVGQSSWGPTLYVATECQAAAERLVHLLSGKSAGELIVTIACPANQGARIIVNDRDRERPS
jgi:beta-RFAP synthase